MTDKQTTFIHEYIKNGCDASKAAIAAGYSAKSARIVASRLLKNKEIREEIDKLLKKASMKAEVDAAKFIAFVKKVAHKSFKGYPVYDRNGDISHYKMDSTALIGSLNIIAKFAGFDRVKVEHETSGGGFGIILNLDGKKDE